MAYAVVTCLYQTVHHLLVSPRTALTPSTQKTLKSARRSANNLQRVLQKFNKIKNSSPAVLRVEELIRDEARRLEDAIDAHASPQFLSQSSHGHLRISLNLDNLKHDIKRFVEAAKKLVAEYTKVLHKRKPPSSPLRGDEGDSEEMVGPSDLFLRVRNHIAGDYETTVSGCAITGMAGIGKTLLVKKIFNDHLVMQKCQRRAFVAVGQNYDFEEILRAIVAQMNVDDEMIMGEDETIYQYFERSLSGTRFLIVLDDVWDDGIFLPRFRGLLLAENYIGSFVLITSRIHIDMEDLWLNCGDHYQMRLLDGEESWELLQRKVFGEGEGEMCPFPLVKAGKKIAENCDGLPLLILTVAKTLMGAPMTPEYWEEVAEMKNSLFEDAMDRIYDLFLPSYHFLRQDFKACFLYMGVFPKGCVLRPSRITSLWRAERFASNEAGKWVVNNLVFNNVVVIRERRFSSLNIEVKGCNLHVVFRHVSKRESENYNFICVLSSYDEDSIERMKDKRHLAIYHNTLLAMKEVHEAISSLSTLRSILCTGPYHQYQVPVICLEMKLLRVLDALTIRFYEFPVEVVKLVQLRYLSLTTNAKIPPSVTKFWFLQFLIIHQHMRINRTSVDEASPYLPVEIWELQELEHLQIVGRNLPHPPPGAILPNLRKLLDVGVETCAKEVLESIPNVFKLRVQLELLPNASQPITFFDHVHCLERLSSLKSVIINPSLLAKPTSPPRFSLYCFQSLYNLTKLSLSGFGYPWEDMSKIAELPTLAYLKLHSYAFRGEKWDAKEMRFFYLEYLQIEDTDLVEWSAIGQSFPMLHYLSMKNCPKLQEFPLKRGIRKVELVDCKPTAEAWANQLVQCDVKVHYSWI